MYCDFFGLRCRPFEDRADTEFYFTTPDHEEAFASIEYEARYGHGMALLLGDPGTGKTLLVRTLLTKLPTSDRAVVLTWPASGQGDLVRETCKGFGISLPASHQSSRLATRLSRHLKRSQQAGHRSVLLIDQAENLTTQNLAELETIMESQRDGESPLSIILSATPRFRDILARDEFGRLRQKLFGERAVGPLTLEQTGLYIIHRLKIAGAGESQPFSPEAFGPIYEASKGIPRLINRICDAAMVATYGAGQSTIGGAVVAEVAMTECGIERSVDVGKLGLDQADLGVPGWPPHGGGGFPALPRRSRPVSDRTPFEEWSEPAVNLGAESDDIAGDPVYASDSTPEPQAGLGVASATERAQLVSLPGAPGSAGSAALISQLTRVTARAERAGATTEASIAQHRAVEKHLTVLNAEAEKLTGRLVATARTAASSLATMQERLASMDEAGEETATGMEEKVSQASHVASELREQIAGVDEACRKGDRVQSQLTAFADELADKGHGVQERMTLLMASVESSDAAQRGLAELLEHASTITAKTSAELSRTVEELEQRIESAVREATSRSGNAEQELEGVVERASSRITDAREQVGALVRTASDIATKTQQGMQRSTAALEKAEEDAHRFEKEFLQTLMERSNTRVSDLHRQVDALARHASDITADTENGLQRSTVALEKAKEDARRFEEELLQTLMERSNTHVSDLHRQVDALVRSASDIATETEQGLQRSTAALEKAKQEARRFEEEFVRAALERGASRVEKELSQHIENQIRSGQESIEAVLNRAAVVTVGADRAVGAIEEKLNSKTAEVEQFIEAFAARAFDACRLKLQADLDAQFQEAGKRITARCGEMDAKLAGYERSTSDLLTAAMARTQELEERVRDLEGGRDEVASTLTSLESAVDDASVRASAVNETVKAASTTVDHLVGRADAAQLGLSHIVPEVEHLIDEAHAVRGKLETLKHGAADTLVDVGRAHEKLASIAQQTGEAERLIGELSGGRDAGESTVRKLRERTQDAEQLIQGALEIESTWTEKATALESRMEGAQTLADQLTRTCAIAKSTNEGIVRAIRRAEDVTQEADRHRSQIGTALASGQKLRGELDEIIISGAQVHEAMQGIVAHADEKVVQLDSHQAAASHVARNLSGLTVTARELLDGLIESKCGSREASERIDRMTTDAWELATAAETRLKELSETSGTARHLVESLQEALRPVESAIAGLIEGNANAKQQVDALDQRETQARELVERIGGITTVLESARSSEKSIKATHEAASETLARLSQGSETAATHIDTLGSLNEAASRTQQQSVESATKAEEAVVRLVAHLSAVEKAVETGTPLLDDFVKQTRSLEGVLGSLDTRCTDIEERFTAATEKPAEIIATAQAQSAQLERVCSAVRKIFSGLSKATLEARKQISDSRTASDSTSKRLSQLTSETERASNTLHEWVQEAVRVQSRLEGTLQRAPSIAETHPADALRAMSRLTTQASGLRESNQPASVNSGSVTVAGKSSSAMAKGKVSATQPVGNRADEVAKLIQDAKRTANTPGT